MPVAPHYQRPVRLAFAPPDHSKDNPVARCWGIREPHGNRARLDARDAVLGGAATLTGQGRHPVVTRVTTVDQTGVTLTNAARARVETHLPRLPGLAQSCVEIAGPALSNRDT